MKETTKKIGELTEEDARALERQGKYFSFGRSALHYAQVVENKGFLSPSVLDSTVSVKSYQLSDEQKRKIRDMAPGKKLDSILSIAVKFADLEEIDVHFIAKATIMTAVFYVPLGDRWLDDGSYSPSELGL